MKTIILAITAALAVIGAFQLFNKQQESVQPRFLNQPSKSPVETAWVHWKQTHGKSYGVGSEEAHRFNIFAQNYAEVNAHNAKQSGYKLGLNKYSDLSKDEFKAQYLKFKKIDGLQEKLKTAPKKKLSNPLAVDWTGSLVTAVKDQGQCGSCWAFSTTGALEGANAKANGDLTPLSEQQFLDCSGRGCNGGNPISAILYAEENGITSESQYPYLATDGHACRFTSGMSVFKPQDFVMADSTDQGLEDAAAVQPVSVAIYAPPIQSYTGGIFDDWGCGDQLDHAVLVVGYTEQYWIVKNSWGADWGEAGYIRMARHPGSDEGICGITQQAVYPTAGL